MRRRELLAGIGSLAALGGGAAVAFDAVGQSTDAVEPVEIETLDAQGSEPGTIMVPERGRVTFVEMFATWCTVCQSMMPRVGEVYDSVGSDVQFLSVTNEPLGNTITREDVRDWWVDHDGHWPVGVDADLTLTQRLDASGVPYAFVFDRQNSLVWEHRGRASVQELTTAIEEVR